MVGKLQLLVARVEGKGVLALIKLGGLSGLKFMILKADLTTTTHKLVPANGRSQPNCNDCFQQSWDRAVRLGGPAIA